MATFVVEPLSADEQVVHVEVSGELDLTNVEDFEERLRVLEPQDSGALVLDLNRVVFIDSAALHALFRMSRRLGRDRFGIVLAPTAPTARTLDIVGLPRAVSTGDSADAVLATFRS
jgi:anti-anti-sigma factor